MCISVIFNMFRRNKGEDKAKLEHKLYLARETPELVFDLSECNIKHVPTGIYSLCKVFLKETLRLEHNSLQSLSGGGNLKDLHLLKVLNIHDNAFTSLPDDLGLLKSLQELYVSNNQLKTLPNSICYLSKLRILDASNNNLKCLPEQMGKLVNLSKLIIIGNKHLNKLPPSICKAQHLTSIELDPDCFSYPPADVASLGTSAIMKFICDDTGCEYLPPEEIVSSEAEGSREAADVPDDGFQAKIWELERIKQQRLQEFLEIERQNEILQQQEIELAQAQRLCRQKLLENIAQEQSKFDTQLQKLQQEKELEKFRLLEQLHQEEQMADVAIKQMLSASREPLSHLLEQEKLEEERFLAATTKYNEELRRDDILNAMQEMLRQETEKFRQFDKNRIETNHSILEQELKSDHQLAEILEDKELHKAELLQKLLEDGDFQKAAVGTLLERSDARSWGLVQQVKLVETQLAALTHIEMNRKRLEVDEQLNDLAEKRINLSILLMELLEQQKERRLQLLNTLQIMESSEDTAEDFWLKQYQRLLDKLPASLAESQKNMDLALVQSLLANNALHCLPFLAKLVQSKCDIRDITEDDLREAGILNRIDREHVLDAFQTFKKEKTMDSALLQPTSPPLTLEEASAPPLEVIRSDVEDSCIICMDNQCEIVFVPCGHLSCCVTCSETLSKCPLCRTDLERKIHIVL